MWLLLLHPWRHIGEALEESLFHMVQTIIGWGFAWDLTSELWIKVRDILCIGESRQEGGWNSLVIHIIKVDVSEVGMALDLFSIRGS